MVQVLNNNLVDRPRVGPPKPDAVRRCFEVGAFWWTVLVTIPIQAAITGIRRHQKNRFERST